MTQPSVSVGRVGSAAGPDTEPDLENSSLYLNREMSWLAFNQRVLGEALDRRWPLLERVKFLAIYSSNLDEFFMIRVSGLHEQLEAALIETNPDGMSAREQLTTIAQTIREQLKVASRLLADDLLPALAEQRIHLVRWQGLDGDTKRRARQYFRRSVFPVLTPLAVDPGHPFPFLSNLSLSLAVEARDPDTGERKFARLKVPEILPRFVSLTDLERAHALGGSASGSTGGESENLLPLEQLIAANLDDLFPGMEILGAYPFRVTRDMDLEILEEEAPDLLSTVDRELRKRRFGACVRLEVDAGIPDRIRRLLLEKLEIDDEDVYDSSGPLGLAALMSVAQLPRPDLHDPPFLPRVPPELGERADLFAAVRKEDVLLHHPYDSFAPVLELLRRAAEDPQVLAIKMTLYRAGPAADACRALIRAAENGKQVAVSIEIKARFDEENNIALARALERAGAHVFFGHAEMKTHAKATLVVRRESDGLRRYVHLSTGNYNAGTARVYTDLGLLTADPEIGEDVSEFFNSLSGFSKKTHHRKLAEAPAELADTVLARIEEQSARARAGRPARIFARLNALVDVRVIKALYRASMAGVKIDLVVRGICCLRPGVPGISDNIRVLSILGRFLEHERVFVFGVAGEGEGDGDGDGEQFFLSSADWMPRNFYRRVELLFPVTSEKLRERIRREVVEPALAEDSRAYVMTASGEYLRAPEDPEQRTVRGAQVEVLERVARRALEVVSGGG
jgi:polyphosphate kinase